MRILFFAHLKDITRCAEMTVQCGETNTAGLWRKLVSAHPGLERVQNSVRLANNPEYLNSVELSTDTDG
ncbi:MAG: hypothetical protein KIS67_08055 [Verrucomicrobiae bacterium]|nr:hypothetical protein [Verrucomicrobiae bacterium]